MNNEEPIAPWYKQPWLWFLLFFPGAAIVWCVSMITVSLNIDNSMVTDDYSKEGRGINMEIARDQAAKAMGLQANLHFDDDAASLSIKTDSPATDSIDFPYLVLNLFHPTLTDRDRTVQFRPEGAGNYVAQLDRPIEGRWYFDLRGPDNDWRLKGEANLPLTRDLILGNRADDRG